MGKLKTLDMLPRKEVEIAAAASQVYTGPVEDENECAVLPVTAGISDCRDAQLPLSSKHSKPRITAPS